MLDFPSPWLCLKIMVQIKIDKADLIMLFISIIQFWVVNNFESLKHMAAKPSDSV